ncbi:hypothetical protein [Actinoallomurus iriomotensis]|uniref:Uncharacterized protein n=1 Tax=Actinoallomurus iriomotensis TaxID=478107 RepID=A0A9W6RBU1_9ACTN|nr:hypothetical protein [Actinoallomurus iriomotensis]GLY72956.1 hypothetical protein Airi01_012230 [Actinoallomurus iriomotensis]
MVAALILVAGLATAAVIFFRLVSGAGPTRTFGPGETVTVHLNKDPRPGFYVTDAGSPDDRCYARDSAGRGFAAEPISGTATITENGTRWHVLSHLRLPADGTYQVGCAPTSASAGVRYGIGTPPGAGRMVGDIFAVILIPMAAFAAAIVIIIVVTVRRSSHRRRLTPPPRPF